MCKLGLFFSLLFALTLTPPLWSFDQQKNVTLPTLMETSHLISVQELQRLIEIKYDKLVILAVNDWLAFVLGHIPNAKRVTPEEIQYRLSEENPLFAPICSERCFEQFAIHHGIHQDSLVVLYDEGIEAPFFWWAFRLYGKDQVFILDGGIRSWKSKGGVIQYGFESRKKEPRGSFIARQFLTNNALNEERVRSIVETQDDEFQIWDVRSFDEWQGRAKSQLVLRRGHLPRARHLPWKMLHREDGTFFPPDEIWRILFNQGFDLSKKHLIYGNTPIEAMDVLYILFQAKIPLEKLFFYEGGLQEWTFNEQNPLINSGAEGKFQSFFFQLFSN